MIQRAILFGLLVSVAASGAETLNLKSCRGYEPQKLSLAVTQENGLIEGTKIATLNDWGDRGYLECRETGINAMLSAECRGRLIESGAKVTLRLSKKSASSREPIGSLVVVPSVGRAYTQLMYCETH